MNIKEQMVHVYEGIYNASEEMRKNISKGWTVHTCTSATNEIGYSKREKVLVVYKKERVGD